MRGAGRDSRRTTPSAPDHRRAPRRRGSVEHDRLDGVDQDLDRGVVEEVEDGRRLVLNGVGFGTTEEPPNPFAEEGEVDRHAAGSDHACGNAVSLNRLGKRPLHLCRQAAAEREEEAVQGERRPRRLGSSRDWRAHAEHESEAKTRRVLERTGRRAIGINRQPPCTASQRRVSSVE